MTSDLLPATPLLQTLTAVLLIIAAIVLLGYLWAVFKFFYYNLSAVLKDSGFYCGQVRHTRLKGGAVHHLQYPIFFSYLDLDEIKQLERVTGGGCLWPLFSTNRPLTSFCSFDESQHLKDHASRDKTFLQRVQSFLSEKSEGKISYKHVRLLTHLTYFGYCFNPISVYYLFDQRDSLEGVIAEVSNTPWIEMHSYALHETVKGVTIERQKDDISGDVAGLKATWKKEFHVSPFMEMDYLYCFNFNTPKRDRLTCSSKMLKASSGDVWFTASFELTKLPFTPANILYVLVFYPLHTRLIQVLIHIEAVKLFWKGVPTFDHPDGTDVDFGFGITGKRLGAVLWYVIQPFYWLSSLFLRSQKKKTQ